MAVSAGDDPSTVPSSAPAVPRTPAPRARTIPSSGAWAGPADDPARYEVFEAVGSGAEGTTYRARYTAVPGAEPLRVALKEVRRPQGAGSHWPHDGTWTGLEQQRALMAGLPASSTLVRVRDTFLGDLRGGDLPASTVTDDSASTPFVVMEWVDGSPLLAALRSGAPLWRRLGWVADLVEAVSLLHSASVQHGNAMVHGDVKPGNCLVTGDGRLVLVDLGAVTHVMAPSTARGLHTPGYASPEVVTRPHDARTPASDLYSLGLTAVAVLTGEPLAPGSAHRPDELRRKLEEALRRAGVRGASRRRLVDRVLGLLAEDPSRRHTATAGAWRREAHRLRHRRRRGLTRAALSVLTCSAVTATLLAATHTPPFDGAVDSEARTIRWDRLDAAPALTSADTALDAEFPRDNAQWAADGGDLVRGGAESLELTAGPQSDPTLVAAPVSAGTGTEVVRATARMEGGQGQWGVWCRGTDDGQRYRFLYSHAGAVAISERGRDAAGAVTEASTQFWWLQGLPHPETATVEGRCSDDEQGVLLEMLVDGRLVLTYRPVLTPLASGGSGLEAVTFDGVTGRPLTAGVTSFVDASAP